MTRTYVALAVAAVLALLLCMGGAIWVWRGSTEFLSESQYQEAMNDLASTEALVTGRLEHFSSLAHALVSSSQFARPNDDALDDVRLRAVGAARAMLLASRDEIDDWLEDELGPPVPIVSKQPGALSLWQLYRGLPLRSASGTLLAASRRALAASIIASNPDVLSIGEIDASGRVVFIVPFSAQTELARFRLGGSSDHYIAMLDPDGPRLAGHSLVSRSYGQTTTFTRPVQRVTGLSYLLLTIRPKQSFDNGPIRPFTLFDSAGGVALYLGDSPLELAETQVVLERALSFGNQRFNLAIHRGPEISQEPVLVRLGALSALIGCSFVGFLLVSRRLLRWIESYQIRLEGTQANVSREAKDLAHDFRKSIVALRALTSTSSDLSLDQLKRLTGVVNDLTGYTDHLASHFAPTAVDLSLLPGEPPINREPVVTYLRGVLETVAQQQATFLGAPIPVVFDRVEPDEVFVAVSVVDLTRIVTNLLHNAIESCHQAGTRAVRITVLWTPTLAIVQVSDDGEGIPATLHERIFDPDFSTRGDGRGKGLPSSVGIARHWSGELRLVRSAPLEGSVMELELPRVAMPSWFCNSVTLASGGVLVIVDDDEEVFEYWEKTITARLEGIELPADAAPTLCTVSGPTAFRTRPDLVAAGTVFLVDQRFKDDVTNGLDLIEEYHLNDRAILVTNHFDEAEVVTRASRLQVRILPKTYMLNARFRIEIGN